MITLSIDVTKIPRDRIIPGKKPCNDGHTAKYLSLVLFENRDGTDAYGNDGFVSVSVTKEERESGVRGPIIGNWKESRKQVQSSTARREEAHLKDKSNGYAPSERTTDHEGEEIPF